MKIATHVLQTLFMILILYGMWQLEITDNAGAVFAVCVGMSLFILLGAGFYLVKFKKVRLFCVALLMALSFSHQVAAANWLFTDSSLKDKEKLEAAKQYIRENKDEVCKAADDIWNNYQQLDQKLHLSTNLPSTNAMLREKLSQYKLPQEVNLLYYKATMISGYYDKMSVWDLKEDNHYILAGVVGFLSMSDDEGLREAKQCAYRFITGISMYKFRNEKPCQTVTERIVTQSSACWPCDIAFIAIEAVQKTASTVTGTLAQGALVLLGIMLLFWILFRVLMLFGQLSHEKSGKFFTDILTRFIIVSIAAVLLQIPLLDFFRMTISPVIDVTTVLSSKFAEYSLIDNSNRTFSEKLHNKMSSVVQGCDDTSLMTRL
ncbi:MAG: hypothetical protein LBU87_07100, partial [Lactobacillales bacterium]|nr:hypothetical protein [Lactobacillales bacterium]